MTKLPSFDLHRVFRFRLETGKLSNVGRPTPPFGDALYPGHDLGVVYGIRFTKYQAERAKAEEEAAAAAAAEAQVEFSYYIREIQYDIYIHVRIYT